MDVTACNIAFCETIKHCPSLYQNIYYLYKYRDTVFQVPAVFPLYERTGIAFRHLLVSFSGCTLLFVSTLTEIGPGKSVLKYFSGNYIYCLLSVCVVVIMYHPALPTFGTIRRSRHVR
jgi:hypothetical protein